MNELVILYLFMGLGALVLGAELLVRGSSRLASSWGIPSLIVGLTIVAFGTSSPELAVSVQSGLEGQPDISIGNVVGSNIFNILFIVGISASITPLIVSHQLVKIDVPIMIFVSLLLLLSASDGEITRFDGSILLCGIILYTVLLVRLSRKENKELKNHGSLNKIIAVKKKRFNNSFVYIILIMIGLVLLVFGSRWLVRSSVLLAEYFGVSKLIIGLTVVAAGTSLPEVATSVVATVKGERDIAVGNLVGSNIFNILVILGISSVVVPDGLIVSESALKFDIPIMIAVSVACLPIFFTGNMISRWEGVLFLSYYGFYIIYLFLAVTNHESISLFKRAMVFFVIPLTAITLAVLSLRQFIVGRK